MTTNVETPETVYAPAGSSTGPFSTVFTYDQPEDVLVTIVNADGLESDLTLDDDYSLVAGVGGSLSVGGSVSLQAAAVPNGGWSGFKLALTRLTAVGQSADLGDTSAFRPSTAEAAFDQKTRIAQENRVLARKAVRAPRSESGHVLPSRGRLKGRLLMGDAISGNLTAMDGAAASALFKGDPGGNVLAVGLFVAGANMTVPVGVDLIQTSGFDSAGVGSALYAYDPDVDEAYAVASPRTAFVTLNGRGFRIVGDVIDAKALGARGDGVTDDTAALQAALDVAEALAQATYNHVVTVHLPRGRYIRSASLKLPNFVHLTGERGAILDSQNVTLNAPILVNKDPANFQFAAVTNVAFHGGTYGVKINVTGGCDGLHFRDCNFLLQDDFNFHANKYLQNTRFDNCVFADADYGVFLPGGVTNLVTFDNCQFNNHPWSCVHIVGGEDVVFINPRFEGGFVGARATIFADGVAGLTIIGGYSELTNSLWLSEQNSVDTTKVIGHHWTYPVLGTSYTIASNGIVSIDTPHVTGSGGLSNGFRHFLDIAGAAHVANDNRGVVRVAGGIYSEHGRNGGKVQTPAIDVSANPTFDLFKISRPGVVGPGNAVAGMAGRLIVNLTGYDGGGTPLFTSRTYHVHVHSHVGGALAAVITATTPATEEAAQSMGAATVTLAQKAGATSTALTLECTVAGMNAALPAKLTAVLEWSAHTDTATDYLRARAA